MKVLKKLFVLFTGKLTALVRVQDGGDSPVICGSPDRVQDASGIQGVGQFPADDPTAEPVDDCGEVHMAMIHLYIRNIDRPGLVGEGNDIVPQQIRHNRLLEVPFGEVRLWIYGVDPHLPHIASD